MVKNYKSIQFSCVKDRLMVHSSVWATRDDFRKYERSCSPERCQAFYNRVLGFYKCLLSCLWGLQEVEAKRL